MRHIPEYARRPLWHTLALAIGAWLVMLGIPSVVYYVLAALTRFFGGAQ